MPEPARGTAKNTVPVGELLFELAVAHRRVVRAVFLKLLYYPLALCTGFFGISTSSNDLLLKILGYLVWGYWTAVVLFSLFAVYKLAGFLKQEQGIGILYAALMFIPIVSLFVLLMLSQQSIKIMKKYGVKVGLMGADLSSIDHTPGDVATATSD